MSRLKGIHFYRVLLYIRILGRRGPMGMYKVTSISKIEPDLHALDIIPTKRGQYWYIDMGDIDCMTLPDELFGVSPKLARSLCQFILDIGKDKIVCKSPEEFDIWNYLFYSIDYDISYKGGYIRFLGRTARHRSYLHR